MFVLSFIFFFFFFHFFFQPHFRVLLFSFFSFFSNFFYNSHWFGMYIFSVFNLFFYFLSLSSQLLILCLLLPSLAYEYASFLSSFFFALKNPRRSFLNHPNFYQFSRQNTTLKTMQNPSLRIFRTHLMRSPKLCAYLNYLQTPVSEYLPQ